MVSSLRTIAKSKAGRGAAFYKKKRCFDSVSSSHRSLALSSGELPALGCNKPGCRPWSPCQTLPCAAMNPNITNHFLNCLFVVVPGVLSLKSCRPRHPRRCLPLMDLALIVIVTIFMVYFWLRCCWWCWWSMCDNDGEFQAALRDVSVKITFFCTHHLLTIGLLRNDP